VQNAFAEHPQLRQGLRDTVAFERRCAVGRCEAKKAKVRLTGWNDGSEYPNRLMADDWWIFEFED